MGGRTSIPDPQPGTPQWWEPNWRLAQLTQNVCVARALGVQSADPWGLPFLLRSVIVDNIALTNLFTANSERWES